MGENEGENRVKTPVNPLILVDFSLFYNVFTFFVEMCSLLRYNYIIIINHTTKGEQHG